MSWSKSNEDRDASRDEQDDQNEYQSYYANAITADYEYIYPDQQDQINLDLDPNALSTYVLHYFLSHSPHECMQSEVFTDNKFRPLEPIRPRVRNILWDSGCSHIMFN